MNSQTVRFSRLLFALFPLFSIFSCRSIPTSEKPQVVLSTPAPNALASLLGDTDQGTRSWAKNELVKLGAAAMPAVIDSFDDASITRIVQENASAPYSGHFISSQDDPRVSILLHVGLPAVPALIEALRDGKRSPAVHCGAIGAMTEIEGPMDAISTSTISFLPLFLGNCWEPIRADVKFKISWLTTEKRAATIKILRLALDDESMRGDALDILGQMGSKGALSGSGPAKADTLIIKAVPRILNLLADPDANTREQAAGALRYIHPTDLKSARRLVQLLSDDSQKVRSAAAQALIGMLVANPSVIPLTINELRAAPSKDAKKLSAWILGVASLGVRVDSAVPVLRSEMADPDLRFACALSLLLLEPEADDAAAVVGEMLRDPKPELGYYALWAIAVLGPRARKMVPSLISLLNEKTPFEHSRIYLALGRIGSAASAASEVLMKQLNDKDYRIRQPSAGALAMIHPDSAAGFVSILQTDLESPDKGVRDGALQVLESVKAPEAQSALERDKHHQLEKLWHQWPGDR